MSTATLGRLFFSKHKIIERVVFRALSSNLSQENNVLKSPFNVEIREQTIPEYIYSRISDFSKYTALECPITGKSYTFDDVRIKSQNFGKSLRKKFKLQKGDVVAFLLANCSEFVIATLGSLEAGLIITTLNPLYTPEEIARQFKDAQPKLIVTQPDLYKNVKTALEQLKLNNVPIVCSKTNNEQTIPNGCANFDELANEKVDYPDFQPFDPNDLAVLPYSSGTTGLPKGVRLSHSNIVSNLHQVDHEEYRQVHSPSDGYQNVVPAVLPMFHIYGFTVTCLGCLSRGSKILPLPKFLPETYINTLKNYDVTHIFAAPPLVLFLTLHPDVKPEDFKTVRNVSSGAAPLGYLDEQRFKEKAGNHICITQGYGLTESSPVLTTTTKKLYDMGKGSGSIGIPLPNTEIKIVGLDDPTGVPLGVNQTGELWAKGPQIMVGYHNRPDETKNTLTEDGWLKTGDVAYFDEDGLIFVTDRLKELIKVKGFQVPPAELEEIVRSFENVSDAAVIGIPHELFGEVPRAYVVVGENKKINVELLENYVKEKVAPYKQLKGGIEIVKSIPKNASGKILRRQLKEMYLSENK